MTHPESEPTRSLLRDVAHFQLKLWIEALRDVVLIPATLVAALLDLALSKQQAPRFFRGLIDIGRRSDEWIDPWAQVGPEAKPAKADAVLLQVENLLRDPKTGSRRARVLLRWAERSLRRQRAAGVGASPPQAPPSPPAPPPGD